MKITDISRALQDAPVYPGSDQTKISSVSNISYGDSYNFSTISTDSHAGTHADAISHFFENNAFTIDKMPLEKYYGRCRVITVPENTPISQKVLYGKISDAKRLAIHSGGKSYLTKDGAEYIVECKIETIVTDALSIGSLDNETEIHKIILGANIAVIENAYLEDVSDGEYILSAFPLKIRGCDGAPVRAVLIQE